MPAIRKRERQKLFVKEIVKHGMGTVKRATGTRSKSSLPFTKAETLIPRC
jgi:hypothetical protein